MLAVPAGETKVPGVVVLQEWWGINEQIQTIARRWADAGFLAIVPDLYHGQLATTAEEAGRMMNALDFGKAVQEIAAAADYLRSHPRATGKIAVSGYCMGGALTFATAVNVRNLAAVVPYYGLPGDLDWSKIDAPIQAHFAQHDDWATVAGAREDQGRREGPDGAPRLRREARLLQRAAPRGLRPRRGPARLGSHARVRPRAHALSGPLGPPRAHAPSAPLRTPAASDCR